MEDGRKHCADWQVAWCDEEFGDWESAPTGLAEEAVSVGQDGQVVGQGRTRVRSKQDFSPGLSSSVRIGSFWLLVFRARSRRVALRVCGRAAILARKTFLSVVCRLFRGSPIAMSTVGKHTLRGTAYEKSRQPRAVFTTFRAFGARRLWEHGRQFLEVRMACSCWTAVLFRGRRRTRVCVLGWFLSLPRNDSEIEAEDGDRPCTDGAGRAIGWSCIDCGDGRQPHCERCVARSRIGQSLACGFAGR